MAGRCLSSILMPLDQGGASQSLWGLYLVFVTTRLLTTSSPPPGKAGAWGCPTAPQSSPPPELQAGLWGPRFVCWEMKCCCRDGRGPGPGRGLRGLLWWWEGERKHCACCGALGCRPSVGTGRRPLLLMPAVCADHARRCGMRSWAGLWARAGSPPRRCRGGLPLGTHTLCSGALAGPRAAWLCSGAVGQTLPAQSLEMCCRASGRETAPQPFSGPRGPSHCPQHLTRAPTAPRTGGLLCCRCSRCPQVTDVLSPQPRPGRVGFPWCG